MAEYALVSAKKKLRKLFQSQFDIPIREIKCLCVDIEYFESFLSNLRRNKVRSIGLEQQIEDIADRIEDLIAFRFSSFENLVEVVHDITSLKNKLKKGEYETKLDPPTVDLLAADDDLLIGCYDSILDRFPDPVGLDVQVMHASFKIMRGTSKLKIVLVYGMAGCGKTTLVKGVYSEMLDFFDIHSMVTIALNFTLRQILVCVLGGLGVQFDEKLGEYELGMSLVSHLKGKRYLLVFDNLWDSGLWNQLKVFFPDDRNKSRIICISRDQFIFGYSNEMEMVRPSLLSDGDSWELLRSVIFTTNESISSQLEEIGKKIAKKCEGLPLAIILMGKLLRESEKTIESWEKALEDDDPLQIKRYDGQPVSKSLYLSYDTLPYYLKQCFLYLGVLPQNHHIKRSEFIKLWIAEGFISYSEGVHLEAAAMRYFMDLIFKNMVREDRSLDNAMVRVHFIFRSLCIREAQDEQFCLVIKKHVKRFSEAIYLQQRLCIHNSTILSFKEMQNSMKLMGSLSSILYCGPRHKYPLRLCLKFKTLKILHTLGIRFYEFPLEVLELLRLRYLAITYDGELPTSITKLWKLEFLILDRCHNIKSSCSPSYLPKEIWNLQWLKHVQCNGLDLQCPNSTVVLEHLSELSGVGVRSCTPLILARMRNNLKKLKVCIELKEEEVENFSFLHDVAQILSCLDSFKCVVHQVFNSHVAPPIPVFPTTISRLSLSGCGLPWKHTSAITVLPNLTNLKLQNYAFCGPVWEVPEGGFPRLMKLVIKDLNIEEWRAKSHQFPNLLFLCISHCYNLQGLPIEFADLPKLGRMYLYSNNLYLEKSLRQILLRRLHLEGDKLEVLISKLDGHLLYNYLPPVRQILLDYDYISTQLETIARKSA